jgi:hypothetical protein
MGAYKAHETQVKLIGAAVEMMSAYGSCSKKVGSCQ